jgi:RNA polymerase sigma factor (TIGR02999 family)
MEASSPKQISQLLVAWDNGDQGALQELIPLVYRELRRLAHGCLAHERPAHTLQTTALVHEAYLRLVDQQEASWKNRAQFFAVAAQMMRRILVDFARARQYGKRGGRAQARQ